MGLMVPPPPLDENVMRALFRITSRGFPGHVPHVCVKEFYAPTQALLYKS